MTDVNTNQLPPLVVGTDPKGVWKAFRPAILLYAVFTPVFAVAAVVLAALVAGTSGFGAGVAAGIVFAMITVYFSFSAIYFTSIAATRAAAGTVATLDGTGLASTTPNGNLVLPWQAIASVQVKKPLRKRVAIFRIADGITHDSPGVQTSMTPAAFRRLCAKGFHIGAAGIDVPIEAILDAAAAFTAGRLVAR